MRFDFNRRSSCDAFEGLPVDGYTAIFSRMLDHPNISLHLGVDCFDLKPNHIVAQNCVYTGPIDRYFDASEGKLGWRTIDFEWEVNDVADCKGSAVMNYADQNVP